MASAEEYFNKGNDEFYKGNFIQAIKYYTKAIELDPDYASAYYNRGVAYANLHQYQKAVEDFSKAIELDPDYAKAYYNRGVAYDNLHQYQKAVEDFSKAIELDPDDASAYYNRGVAYANLHQYQKAVEDFSKAIELDPDDAKAYYNRGVAYDNLHQYQKAVEDYSKAIELDPDYAKAYYNRGVAYDNLHQYQKAVEDYSKAIELDPDDAKAYYNRGVAYANLHQYQKAVEDFSKVIELDPDDAKAYNNRGVAYDNLHQYQKAVEDFSKAIELDPDDASAYYNRGVAYANLHQYQKAVEDYSKAIELDPDYAKAYNNRGVAYDNLHQYQKAVEDYSKAIELDPDDAKAYYNRGRILIKPYNDIPNGHEDYLRFVHLSNGKELIKHLSALLTFFRDNTDDVMVVRRMTEKIPSLAEIIHFQDYIETCLAKTQPFDDFFTYRQEESGNRSYLFSQALVNYYFGDEGSTFTIIDSKIEVQEDALLFSENYYYFLTARIFGNIYRITPEEILEDGKKCVPGDTPTETYYEAWHQWLLDNESEAIAIARQNRAYLPSLYQLLLFTKDISLISEIKSIEGTLSPQQGFLHDFTRRIHPNEDEYLSRFLDYAHYAELEEAIRMVNYAHQRKPMDQAIDIDFLTMRDEMIREQADKLLKSIYSEKEKNLQGVDSQQLREEIEGLHKYMTDEFEHIRDKADSLSSLRLEKKLAEFIHAWALEEQLTKSKVKADISEYYEKVIRYFYLNGSLDMITYIILYYYILRRDRIIHRNHIDSPSEESLLDTAKDLLKNATTSAPPAILMTMFDPTLMTFAGGMLASYFAKIGISRLVSIINQADFSKRGAKEDYELFKSFFIENTIEEILKVKSEGFINSKTHAELSRFYDEYQFVIRKKSS